MMQKPVEIATLVKSKKSVHFPPEHQLTKVYLMSRWVKESKAARKPWSVLCNRTRKRYKKDADPSLVDDYFPIIESLL